MSSSEYDRDLNPVLKKCTNDELELLIGCFLHKSSEMLTWDSTYKMHYPNHKKYTDVIAEEVRKFGGHTVANIARDVKQLFIGGSAVVPYKEIACDVAKELEVTVRDSWTIEKIEEKILDNVFGEIIANLTEEEKEIMAKEIYQKEKVKVNFTAIATIRATEYFKSLGFKAYIYIMKFLNKIIIKSLISAGILSGGSFTLNWIVNKSVGKLIPILNVASWLWLASDIAGVAYRVTIPSVIHVAIFRQCQLARGKKKTNKKKLKSKSKKK